MLMLITLLALSGAALAQRNTPHPCSTWDGTTVVFTNDYANCAAYFWCESATVGHPTGPCAAGFIFDQANQGCNPDPATVCDPCPATGLWAVRFFYFN